jgi:carbon monoxide dehydrogenase subunit G
MSITVPFDVTREFEVKARAPEVFAVLSHVPTSASHFPKLARLVDLGRQTYRWEMEKIGTGQISVQTVYASKYVSNAKKGSVVWTPVEGEGNALIGGSWAITPGRNSTRLVLTIDGELHVPLPGIMKMIVVPTVTRENDRLIDGYVANLTERFGGAA